MYALLSKFSESKGDFVSVGTDGRHITKKYKSFAFLYRYGIRPYLKLWDGKLKAEIYTGSFYNTPDKVITWNNNILK